MVFSPAGDGQCGTPFALGVNPDRRHSADPPATEPGDVVSAGNYGDTLLFTRLFETVF